MTTSIQRLRKRLTRARNALSVCEQAQRSAVIKTQRAEYAVDEAAAKLNLALRERDVATIEARSQ